MEEKITVGGQAVIEGVMMRGPEGYAIAVRGPDKKIVTQVIKTKKNPNWFINLPIVRGCVRFADTLVIGMKAISFSANMALEEEEKLTNKDLAFTILLSILINVALFIFVPLFLTNLIADKGDRILYNLVDGGFRLLMFLAFLMAISFMKDIKRLFQYHGAEHMAVNCYEAGKKLTVDNVRKFSTIHPRCGTTFLLLVFSVSILVFSFVPTTNLYVRFFSRLLLIPIVAGISYEILKFTASHYRNPIVRAVMFPGLMLQKITTRVPDDSQIEVGIVSLKSALDA